MSGNIVVVFRSTSHIQEVLQIRSYHIHYFVLLSFGLYSPVVGAAVDAVVSGAAVDAVVSGAAVDAVVSGAAVDAVVSGAVVVV